MGSLHLNGQPIWGFDENGIPLPVKKIDITEDYYDPIGREEAKMRKLEQEEEEKRRLEEKRNDFKFRNTD